MPDEPIIFWRPVPMPPELPSTSLELYKQRLLYSFMIPRHLLPEPPKQSWQWHMCTIMIGQLSLIHIKTERLLKRRAKGIATVLDRILFE